MQTTMKNLGAAALTAALLAGTFLVSSPAKADTGCSRGDVQSQVRGMSRGRWQGQTGDEDARLEFCGRAEDERRGSGGNYYQREEPDAGVQNDDRGSG